MTTRATVAIAALALQGACGALDPEPSPSAAAVESARQPLWGGQTYDGCTHDRIARIHQAIAVLYQVSSTGYPALQRCLLDAALVENRCQVGATIASYLRSNAVTRISCRDLPGASSDAPLGIAGEQLTLDNAFVLTAGARDIPAAIGHELMHNRGFEHWLNAPGSLLYPNTVPEQMEACILRGVANNCVVAARRRPRAASRRRHNVQAGSAAASRAPRAGASCACRVTALALRSPT
jgi:hypothetical protein